MSNDKQETVVSNDPLTTPLEPKPAPDAGIDPIDSQGVHSNNPPTQPSTQQSITLSSPTLNTAATAAQATTNTQATTPASPTPTSAPAPEPSTILSRFITRQRQAAEEKAKKGDGKNPLLEMVDELVAMSFRILEQGNWGRKSPVYLSLKNTILNGGQAGLDALSIAKDKIGNGLSALAAAAPNYLKKGSEALQGLSDQIDAAKASVKELFNNLTEDTTLAATQDIEMQNMATEGEDLELDKFFTEEEEGSSLTKPFEETKTDEDLGLTTPFKK